MNSISGKVRTSDQRTGLASQIQQGFKPPPAKWLRTRAHSVGIQRHFMEAKIPGFDLLKHRFLDQLFSKLNTFNESNNLGHPGRTSWHVLSRDVYSKEISSWLLPSWHIPSREIYRCGNQECITLKCTIRGLHINPGTYHTGCTIQGLRTQGHTINGLSFNDVPFRSLYYQET